MKNDSRKRKKTDSQCFEELTNHSKIEESGLERPHMGLEGTKNYFVQCLNLDIAQTQTLRSPKTKVDKTMMHL